MTTCDQCKKKHTRTRFCSNKCKDRWHNKHNPRGYGDAMESKVQMNDDTFCAGRDAIEDGWDGHKGAY